MNRSDHDMILELIEEDSKVLDLGCGDGKLLKRLTDEKNIKGSGIEISENGVSKSISKGLSVIQGNLEEIIVNYPENSFDYCILSQTLQELKRPDFVFEQMMRISKNSIFSFINLANFRYRLQILFTGKFPKPKNLPLDWKTTNVAFLSVKNFREYCVMNNFHVEKEIFLHNSKRLLRWTNMRANLCVFKIKENI